MQAPGKVGSIQNIKASAVVAIAFFIGSVPAVVASAEPVGPCGFDTAKVKFADNAANEARCLLRKVRPKDWSSDDQVIPQWLLTNVGEPVGITALELSGYLSTRGIDPQDVGDRGEASARKKPRYFVIHETGSPVLTGLKGFPERIDSPTWFGNRLERWASFSPKIHLIINRAGESRGFRDWSDGQREAATKLEEEKPDIRPYFLHVQNVEPRIKPLGSSAWIAPQPGFSDSQMERLALSYIVASVRAEKWLIPAFRYNVSQSVGADTSGDDPQNFDLKKFTLTVEQQRGSIIKPAKPAVAVMAQPVVVETAPSGMNTVVQANVPLKGGVAQKESTCYGRFADGRLADGVQLPLSGPNFEPYATEPVNRGRVYVHSKVARIVANAYSALPAGDAAARYVYGESGRAKGGVIEPHKTHQNGLSVDFMVPVRDAAGKPVRWSAEAPLYGYEAEFDGNSASATINGKTLTIDFEAIAMHLLALHKAAVAENASIHQVYFDKPFIEKLKKTSLGSEMTDKRFGFNPNAKYWRHDEHYHVDFSISCK